MKNFFITSNYYEINFAIFYVSQRVKELELPLYLVNSFTTVPHVGYCLRIIEIISPNKSMNSDSEKPTQAPNFVKENPINNLSSSLQKKQIIPLTSTQAKNQEKMTPSAENYLSLYNDFHQQQNRR